MPKFLTRIRLEGARPAEVEVLDQEMQKANFVRIDRTVLHSAQHGSPTSEYNYQGFRSILELNGAIARAVEKTGRQYAFTIIREKKLHLS